MAHLAMTFACQGRLDEAEQLGTHPGDTQGSARRER